MSVCKVMLLCVLLCVALLATLADAVERTKAKEMSDELSQKPIFFSGEFRRSNRALGEPCTYSFDCSSNCCLKETGSRRQCSRKARKGELCSVSQVKLDLYMEHCPCEEGNRYCSEDPKPKCLA
uniref:U10-Liphistoxin-Lsp1a_1 n=2 Tax=Liphistius TaxID=62150 RepID=A0A4Q8K7W4_9ARAC